MNDNAKAWVAALRSGEYRQARRVLTKLSEDSGRVVGHCCLGVACELAVKAGVIKAGLSDHGYLVYDHEHYRLPPAVQNWLGLRAPEGEFKQPAGEPSCLSAMNDGGNTFEQIADVIESEPKGLFV